MATLCILDYYHLSDSEYPDFVGTTGPGGYWNVAFYHVSWFYLRRVGNVLYFAFMDRSVVELWNMRTYVFS